MNYNKSSKKLNWKNVRNYLIAQWRYKILKKDWQKDQAGWRKIMIAKNSPECLKNGECKCLCEIEELVYSPDTCEDACYPLWMNEEEWYEFAKNNNIW